MKGFAAAAGVRLEPVLVDMVRPAGKVTVVGVWQCMASKWHQLRAGCSKCDVELSVPER